MLAGTNKKAILRMNSYPKTKMEMNVTLIYTYNFNLL